MHFYQSASATCDLFFYILNRSPFFSSETVSLWRPLARRRASTWRPLAVDIRSRKPCLFFRFRFDGWYVLFMIYNALKPLFPNELAKIGESA